MSSSPASLAALICLVLAVPAAAQAPPSQGGNEAIPTGPKAPAPPPPAEPAPPAPAAAPVKPIITKPVEVTQLAAPDAFTTPARATGLPATLWRGTSLAVVKAVLPKLAEKPLSGAAGALARRVLGTGAPGPDGAAQAPELAGARAAALMAQGDPKGAAAILAHAPGVDSDPGLARVAADTALLAGDDARACATGAGLTAGRDEIYWVRLRAYCQAVAGKTAEAQLSFELAQSQAKDATFARLMAAKLSGTKPGPASLRNALDYALSRSLGLDTSTAKPAPAVAAALAAGDPTEPTFDASSVAPDLQPIAEATRDGKDILYRDFMGLMNSAQDKGQQRIEAALLLMEASRQGVNGPLAFMLRHVASGRAPVAEDMALRSAADRKLMGETAVWALWISAEAGPTGLAVGDRTRIVDALARVGLETDARNFALEGLIALK